MDGQIHRYYCMSLFLPLSTPQTSAQQAVMVERLTRVPAAPERPPQKMGFVKCKLINGKMQEELVPPPVLPEKEYTRRLVEAHVKQTTKHKESIDKLRDKYYVPLVRRKRSR